MRKSITIGIAGAGGDGVVMMGNFLQKLAACQGYYGQMPRYYGAQIRGGGSALKLSLDTEHPSLPDDALDLMVCFDWSKYQEFSKELPLGPGTVVFHEDETPAEITLPPKAFHAGFSERSREITGSASNKNLVALGLLTRLLGLPQHDVLRLIKTDKALAVLKRNLPAFEAGEKMSSEFGMSDLVLSPAPDKSPRFIIHGSGAVAQAAIRAGCRAFFGYPITPASEIMQEMQARLASPGGVYLQAEDEIASAGLTVGSSLTGAKSMTSTSGPGLDLMTEVMGLAVSAEIPLVIADVQRCGPSTGIPSKSEQSDLNHAIYGGHGDAPRVVIASHDIESCYRLAIEAFNSAERFQTVAILLLDQWLGQTLVATNEDFTRRDYPIIDRTKPGAGDRLDYKRYLLTDDLVSPMSAAGDEGFQYQTSGLTHGQSGEPALSYEAQQKLHEKRWLKLAPLRLRDDLVNISGNRESTRGIITWGSSAQIVRETVRGLGLEDELQVCVPELIQPLPQRVEQFLKSTGRLLVVEMNYSGQFHRYLRSVTDLPADTRLYCRAGGRPFSRQELAAPIKELLS